MLFVCPCVLLCVFLSSKERRKRSFRELNNIELKFKKELKRESSRESSIGAIACRGLIILHTMNEKSSEKHSDEDQNGGFGKMSHCPSPILEDEFHEDRDGEHKRGEDKRPDLIPFKVN